METIENNAFNDCTGLKKLQLGKSVEKIGYEAFRNCALKKVVIPKSVEEIDNRAFYSNGDNTVYLFAEVEEGEQMWKTPYNVTVYWAGEWEYRNGEPYPLG